MVDEFSQAQVPGQGGRQEQGRHWPPGDGRQRGCGYGRVCSVAASIGCSLFPGGFLFQNHYPRFRGAPSSFFRAVPKAVLRWIRVKADEPQVRHRRRSPDDGQRPQVPKPERIHGLPGESAADGSADVSPLCQGYVRRTAQRKAGLVGGVGQIAYDEYLGMPRHR